MASLYTVQTTLQQFLLDDTNIMRVTFGDLDDMDIDKVGDYPLAHIDHEGTRVLDNVKEFDFTIYIGSPLEEFTQADAFGSRDNLHYIYNELDTVVEQMHYRLKRGLATDRLIKLVGNISVEAYKDFLENRLSGYSITFTLEVAKAYVNV